MDRVSQGTPIEDPIFMTMRDSIAKTTAETEAYIAQIQSKIAVIGVHPLDINKTSDHSSAKMPVVKDPSPPTVINDLWDLHQTMRSNVEHLHLINEALVKLVGG